MEELQTKIERIERGTVEAFNKHVGTVLDQRRFENIDRIWLNRLEKTVREGRWKVSKTTFEHKIVRTSDGEVTYEDTIDNLSESEREVTSLVFHWRSISRTTSTETYQLCYWIRWKPSTPNESGRWWSTFRSVRRTLSVTLLPEDTRALEDEYRKMGDPTG